MRSISTQNRPSNQKGGKNLASKIFHPATRKVADFSLSPGPQYIVHMINVLKYIDKRKDTRARSSLYMVRKFPGRAASTNELQSGV